MAVVKVIKRVVIEGVLAVAMIASVLGIFLYIDHARMVESRPPNGLATLREFMAWKGDGIQSRGEYTHGGKTFTVYCAPAGRCLASGPSGYLFDEHDRFVDWTPDTGDIPTEKHGFPLMSGVIRFQRPSHAEPLYGP